MSRYLQIIKKNPKYNSKKIWTICIRYIRNNSKNFKSCNFDNNSLCNYDIDNLLINGDFWRSEVASDQQLNDDITLCQLIHNFQARGHYFARLDPLNIVTPDIRQGDKIETVSKLIQVRMGQLKRQFANEKREFKLPKTTYIGGGKDTLTLNEIFTRLEKVYCTSMGIEYIYMANMAYVDWLKQKLETPGEKVSVDEKRTALRRVMKASKLEDYFAKKWPSEKRFGLEGCESTIAALGQIIDTAALMGVEQFVIGMAHRGRINVLANTCKKPLYQIFTQFHGLEAPDDYGAGDVKYHLGTSVSFQNRASNKLINVAVVANASHLEAVNPVVLGKTCAEMFQKNDVEGTTVMPILIHGDASFSGQGICFETAHLCKLPMYSVNGAVHIVINNQIGFTTDPRFHRSSAYCTDVAKVVNAPIFHVNGDDVPAVIHSAKLATECRMHFRRCVVIDVIGYRRRGHNEADEPMFTQPLMYNKIKATPTVLEKYSKQLIEENHISREEHEKNLQSFNALCDSEFEKSKQQKVIRPQDWLDSKWGTFFKPNTELKTPITGISMDVITHIGKVFSSPPTEANFDIHMGIRSILNIRMIMVQEKTVDWALSEAIAFGSLLKDGVHVRLSGQDVERGTFGQRHHVLHHQTKDKVTYGLLNHLYSTQAVYSICNSPIGQNGVLGFELGYSTVNPMFLVLWEAQFGDFANNAQVILDQFISGGQDKWVRQTGLVLLLPHGMEGQGSEHSNARPERYLLACNDEPDKFPKIDNDFAINQLNKCNWIVANCSTPANYFHILRRQILLPFRKPLIIFTPKSLLRHPACKSRFDEMSEGTEFKRVIPDYSKNPEKIKKLLFCSGKVYYDIMIERGRKKLDEEIAICRIEQLSPFPFDLILAEMEKYKSLKHVCWLQEEHKNSGPWVYVRPRFAAIGLKHIEYIGRPTSSAAATGFRPQHVREEEEMIRKAIMV